MPPIDGHHNVPGNFLENILKTSSKETVTKKAKKAIPETDELHVYLKSYEAVEHRSSKPNEGRGDTCTVSQMFVDRLTKGRVTNFARKNA